METILTASHTQLPNLRRSTPFPRPVLPPPLPLPLRPLRRGATNPPLLCSRSPPSFNGWEDDLDRDSPGPDPLLRLLLSSLGISDRNHVFVFCLGFASALAISRVRPTLMAMVPISILAFFAGFSTQALRGAGGNNGDLVGFFEFLDAKVSELKDAIGAGDAERCLVVAEAVSLAAAPVRKAVGGLPQRKTDRKPVGRRRERNFDIVDVVTRFLRENLVSDQSGASNKQNTRDRSDDGVGELKGSVSESGKKNNEPSQGSSSGEATAKDATRRTRGIIEDGLKEEQADLDETFRFINRKKSFERMVLEQKSYIRENVESSSTESKSDPWSLSESGSALHAERTVEIRNRSYNEKLLDERWKQIDGFSEVNDQVEPNSNSHNEQLPSPASSEEEFSLNVKEAEILLKQAKEYLRNEDNEEEVETRLYRSAQLLSTAVSLQPRSLLAVGQLGNTYLLHGELKLRISRDLRTLLSRSGSSVITRKGSRLRLKGLNKSSVSREKVATVLIDVCEECEELLVKAGKSYRMALSIDGNDIRALYNWGLALTFRAQLIADIGPEAAFDADKVYLAAIDKFSALTSRSRRFAPEALFRWGLALQQRSQLRPPDSREKMKLLKQAKSLFDDVLRSDTDNPVVREALFSCISELNFYRQLE